MKGEEDPNIIQVGLPVLNQKDKKRYETVEEAIKGLFIAVMRIRFCSSVCCFGVLRVDISIVAAGHWQKLKVHECKVYMRKHGMRLTGNKETLIQRIREHIE